MRLADIRGLARALLPALIVGCLSLAALWLLLRTATPPAALRVDSIEARPSREPEHWLRWHDEAPDAWRRYDLPTRVCKIRCKTPYTAWRLRFRHDPARGDDLAVYLPHASTNAAFYLNGTLVHVEGRMRFPPSGHRYTPRLIRLPPGLLRPGENVLHWRLTIEHRGIGGVDALYMGRYRDLLPAQRALRFLSHDLIQAAFWLQIGALLFAVGLFFRDDREPIVRYFLLAAPCWLLLSAWYLHPDLAASANLRYALFFSAMFGVIAFSSLFILSIVRPPPRWIVRTALGYALAGTALAAFAYGWPDLDMFWRYSLPNRTIRYSALLILPFVLYLMFSHLNRNRDDPMSRWVFAASAMSGACGAHDVVVGAMGGLMRYNMTPLAGLGIAVAFLLEIGRRVLANRREMARYNEHLHAVVAEKEAELRANLERLRKAEVDRSLADERARIMRDMHDGVGGQLAALVHLSADSGLERAEILQAVRDGLADMRLVLDSLNQTDHDLLIALAAFRERCQALLRGTGIALRWRQSPALAGRGFGPEATLQIYRVLQEAMSNAMRHAGAREIDFEAAIDEARDELRLTVIDDGQGFDPDGAQATGHYGLAGMRQRAAKLGGRIDIASTPGRGTRLDLVLPPCLPARSLR